MHLVPRSAFLLIGLLALAGDGFAAGRKSRLTLSCAPENDVFIALTQGGDRPARFNSPAEAIQRAKEKSAVLILAEGDRTNLMGLEPAVR